MRGSRRLVLCRTPQHECNHCRQKGHYIVNIDDKTGKKIYCAKFLIDNGFPTTTEDSMKKPMRSFARPSKRFSSSMKQGAKALLLSASHMMSRDIPNEVTATLNELEHSSESSSDGDTSGVEDTAERIEHVQRPARTYRGKSPTCTCT